MAVVGVVLQLKEEGGLHPLGVVPRHAQLNGQLVHLGERDVQATVGQKVGVILHHLHRQVPESLVEGHGGGQGQLVLSEKLRQVPHAHLGPEALADGAGPLEAHPSDLGQLLRGILNDLQGLCPELIHNLTGQPHADALHRP